MSWNDNDIDQLFKGAKAPEPPPFREEFWTEMEVLLPAQKRRRGALLWWISGAAVIAALLGIAGFWFTGNREAATTAVQPMKGPATTDQSAPNEQFELQQQHTTHAAAPETAPVRSRIENGTMANAYRVQYANEQASYPEAGLEELTPAEKTEANSPEEIGTLPVVAFADGISPFLVERSVPEPTFPRAAERFYGQAVAGIGQSSQRNVANASGLVHFYALGGGLYKRVDNVVLTFGVNARVDFAQNVIGSTGFSEPDRTDTKYSELYSVETPASLGFNYGRNTFSILLTPGFQAGFSGKASDFEDNVEVRSERTSGKVEHSKTLTMEIGFGYWRTLQPNWYLGASVNADALRPFNPSNFAGEQRLLPLNGQVMLRRTF